MIVKKYDLFIDLIVLYCFTTLTYTLWPISSPNMIVGILMFIVVLWIGLTDLSKKRFVLYFTVLFLFIFSFLFCENYSRNLTDGIYWIISIILMNKISNRGAQANVLLSLKHNKKLIKASVIILNMLLIISFFFPNCYLQEWGSRYYIGFTNASHTLCSGVCLLMVLILCVLTEEKKNIRNIAYFIPGIIAILESGARIFLIPVIVILYVFYRYYIDSITVKTVCFPILIIAAIYIFINSGMLEKFAFVKDNTYISSNMLGQITSGRTEFWMIDLNAFQDYSLLNKLVGKGFDNVYRINKAGYGMAIWAHNDVINTLLSTGLLGCLLYLIAFIQHIYTIFKSHSTRIERALISSYIVIPMLLNGYCVYQHYLYSAIIFITLYLSIQDTRQRVL